jgi:hypothetical protein
MSEQVTPGAELRASDAERERTATTLRDHAAVGRLDVDELAERLDIAYSAHTRSELDALLADLPRPGAGAKQLGFSIHRSVYVLTSVAMVAIWALTGAGYFWPVWPMLGWGIGVLSHGGACGSARRTAAHGSGWRAFP